MFRRLTFILGIRGFFFFFFFCIHVWVPQVCKIQTEARGRHWVFWNCKYRQLWTSMWIPGAVDAGSSTKAIGVLNHWAISSIPLSFYRNSFEMCLKLLISPYFFIFKSSPMLTISIVFSFICLLTQFIYVYLSINYMYIFGNMRKQLLASLWTKHFHFFTEKNSPVV